MNDDTPYIRLFPFDRMFKMSYREICSCVSCESIFPCNPQRKTRLCVHCDTPVNNKLRWECKLEMAPCLTPEGHALTPQEAVLVISEGVEVKKRE